MGEQSHLEAMREAIKGDLERARARRPSIFERPSPPPLEIREKPPPESGSDPPGNTLLQGMPGAEQAAELVPEPVPEPEPEAVPEPVAETVAEEPVPDPQLVAEEPPQKGLLRRVWDAVRARH